MCASIRFLHFMGKKIFTFFFFNPSLLLSWMFEHDCLDTSYFRCLTCMCFIFLYLHLFSAIQQVSHGKAL